MEDTNLVLVNALWIACEEIQRANQNYTIEQLVQHFVKKARDKMLAELEETGRSDN